MNRAKRFIAATIVISFLAGFSVHADDYTLIDGVGRGFANILAGWLEVPRGLTYYAVEYPVIGVVPGALEGAGMTGIRAVGGLIDILTIGYLRPGRTVYDTMDAPLYPWESPWLPPPDEEED